jgi:hypothetical protein
MMALTVVFEMIERSSQTEFLHERGKLAVTFQRCDEELEE